MLLIEKLEPQIARLRHEKCGQSSERRARRTNEQALTATSAAGSPSHRRSTLVRHDGSVISCAAVDNNNRLQPLSAREQGEWRVAKNLCLIGQPDLSHSTRSRLTRCLDSASIRCAFGETPSVYCGRSLGLSAASVLKTINRVDAGLTAPGAS